MTETITTAADAVHWLAIDADWGEPRLKLVCTAAKAALSTHTTEAHGCTCTECQFARILNGDPNA